MMKINGKIDSYKQVFKEIIKNRNYYYKEKGNTLMIYAKDESFGTLAFGKIKLEDKITISIDYLKKSFKYDDEINGIDKSIMYLIKNI